MPNLATELVNPGACVCVGGMNKQHHQRRRRRQQIGVVKRDKEESEELKKFTWHLQGEEGGAGAEAELAGELPGHGHRRHRLLAVPGNARELRRREVRLHRRQRFLLRRRRRGRRQEQHQDGGGGGLSGGGGPPRHLCLASIFAVALYSSSLLLLLDPDRTHGCGVEVLYWFVTLTRAGEERKRGVGGPWAGRGRALHVCDRRISCAVRRALGPFAIARYARSATRPGGWWFWCRAVVMVSV